MGQRLDDDAFLINKDDVSIPENFDIQRSRPIFGVKGKRKNSIKAYLVNACEACISKVFSENHGKWRGRHGHGPVALGGVDSFSSNKDKVLLFSALGIDSQNDLFVVGHVCLLDVGTRKPVQLSCHNTKVKSRHSLLHSLTFKAPNR